MFPHKVPGYAIVTLSLKKTGVPPGDATSDQMDTVADLADAYSFGELTVSHEQNLIFTDVRQSQLLALWSELKDLGLATPNIGLLTDIVCCPGGDFCSLANAKSIPIAEAIQRRFDDLDYLHDIGDIDLNISGCMNACGHHHVGHIGVLGVDKNGSEWYQVTIGGTQGENAAIGKVIGPSFAAHEMPDVVARLLDVYVDRRHEDERFVDTVRRLGTRPLQGARLCRSSLRTAQLIEDRWTLVREASARRHCRRGGVRIVPLALWLASRDDLCVARRRRRVARACRRPCPPRRRRGDAAADRRRLSRSSPMAAGYSTGRLLRERFGFHGELRAIGDIQRDQLYYLYQVGFDAFVIRDGKDAQDALRSLRDFSDGYQLTQPAHAVVPPVRHRRARSARGGAIE